MRDPGEKRQSLPEIEVIDVGARFPMELARRLGRRSFELREEAIGHVPRVALELLDRLARHWLRRNGPRYLAEIEELAAASNAPGLYFLNVSYEWGCTTMARPAPDGAGAVLQRTLDWDVDGLGRHIAAARISCPLGTWVSLTWPAFTGVIQALAPGRFAAAINQPMPPRRAGHAGIDWLLSRYDVWRSRHIQPAHLLREVFETAPDYSSAFEMLTQTPVAAPVIYTLAGIGPGETVTIERQGAEARVIVDGLAANEWRAPDWQGGQHGAFQNEARLAALRAAIPTWDPELTWVRHPVLNPSTRLAMLACPSSGRLIARGYELGVAATATLDLRV